jgi:SPP1 family predicted phage head-tail adaptor
MNQKIDILTSKDYSSAPITPIKKEYEPIISNIWAKRRQLLGKEAIKQGAEHNIIQVNFTIRARKDIDESMYIGHQGNIYNIVGIAPLDDYPAYMLIATVKVV